MLQQKRKIGQLESNESVKKKENLSTTIHKR